MASIFSTNLSFQYSGSQYALEGVSLNTTTSTQNLIKLFQRKKGTLFQVDENDRLVEVQGWKDWLGYQWNRQGEQAKVKIVIDRALEEFNEYLSRVTDQKTAETACQFLFSQSGAYGIGRLSQSLYNHKIIRCDNLLSKYLLPTGVVRMRLPDRKFVDFTGFDPGTLPPNFLLPDFDLKDETANYNFYKLLKRKKGVIYQVNAAGKLEKVSGGWTYRHNKKEIEQRVESAVTDVLKRLNYQVAQMEMTQAHKFVMGQIFSEHSPLCRMKRQVFNRGVIGEGSFIETLLTTDLVTKRAEVAESIKSLRDVSTEEERVEAKIHVEKTVLDFLLAEFDFVRRLGLDLERVGDGGTGGARYARDRFGRKILVIKPNSEGPTGLDNNGWMARLKRWFLSPNQCFVGNSESLAEFESWAWDRKFGIWVVPPTKIGYVASRDFINTPYKECSAQMFVKGCSTIGEHVGISPWMHWLPRPFLRWYCGSRFGTGPFYALSQREQRKEELIAQLPQKALERAAIHDVGIENGDCHFENILVKIITERSEEENVLARILKGDAEVTDEQIDEFVSTFFEHEGNQVLLDEFLYSETVEVEGISQKISLIKHDGGASNPRSHPSFWNVRAKRYKHLFEVLPQFEQFCSEPSKDLLRGKEEEFAEFLLDKAQYALRNILEREIFESFWTIRENKDLLQKWVFETNEIQASALQKILQEKLSELTDDHFKPYYLYHLKRIRQNLQTRIDSFRVLNHFVESENFRMMRELCSIKSEEDFQAELNGLQDGFDLKMENWKSALRFTDESAG